MYTWTLCNADLWAESGGAGLASGGVLVHLGKLSARHAVEDSDTTSSSDKHHKRSKERYMATLCCCLGPLLVLHTRSLHSSFAPDLSSDQSIHSVITSFDTIHFIFSCSSLILQDTRCDHSQV